MKYLLIAVAIILEVIGSSCMQMSNGFTKVVPTSITIIAYITCFYFFSQALKYIPLGIAYAVWAGLGIVLTAIVSVIVFKQKIDFPSILGMVLIVSGVVVMNLFSKTTGH
ncbi:MAG: DMT family transporter [Mesonia sp.]|uniref:DMT family transporter n=1 Tax=Mesonia sp. TaxID=1960830 RepID=UPI003F980015